MKTFRYQLVTQKITQNALETREFGLEMAQTLHEGKVLAFSGDLGSGKTTLIQGICTGLGVTETVTSPTFTLINEYRGRMPVYHFDFYRMHSLTDLHDLGVEEYFYGTGICLVEGAVVVEAWLPESHLRIRMAHGISAAAQIETLSSSHFNVTPEVRLIEVFRSDAIGD